MLKQDSKCKNKINTTFSKDYQDVFLVSAMLMITGVLLAVSASAQFDQPSGDFGQKDPFSQNNFGGEISNQQPMLTALESDRTSPQEAGSSIGWTARAEDPENDPISFLFRLRGPATGDTWGPGDIWKQVSQWSPDNTWKWDTKSEDVGRYQISVWVRDEMHAGPQFTPDEKIVDFLLTAPQSLAAAIVQPIVEPSQVAPTPEPTYAPPVEMISVNQAPVMISLMPSPVSPQEAGAAITWVAEAGDQEGDSLQFLFLLDDQPVSQWQYQNQWTWHTAANDIGVHSIEARVKDGGHSQEGDDSRKASFTIIKPNEKPIISDLSADKTSPQEMGSIVIWSVQAIDADNDPILFRFFLNGIPVTNWQSSSQWAWTASEGEATVMVQARDGKHAEQDGFDDSRSATFVIMPPNQKPAIINFSPDKLSPQEIGSTITWTVEVMDAENDPLEYQFLLDSQVVQDWSARAIWSWTDGASGTHVVEAKVRDGKHDLQGDSSSSASFEIVLPPNDAPVLSSLTADKVSPQVTGSAVVFTAAASDPENDLLFYKFFLNNQTVQDWSTNSSYNWKTNNLNVGSNRIEVWIRDGMHAGLNDSDDARSSDFEVTDQRPFLLTPLLKGPISGYVGSEYLYLAEINESERSRNIKYQFEWDGKQYAPIPQNKITYRWHESGEKNVRVRIIDEELGIEGDWSQLVTVFIYNNISINSSDDMDIQETIERLENYTEINLTGEYLFDEEIEVMKKNNVIIQASKDRVTLKGRRLLPRMISLKDCNNITIRDLKISNAKTGVKITNSNDIHILNNAIEFGGCYCGIKHVSGERNSIVDNQLKYNSSINCYEDGESHADKATAIILEKCVNIDVMGNIFPTNMNPYISYYVEKNNCNKNVTITIPSGETTYLIIYGNCQGTWKYSEGIIPRVDTENNICDIPDKNNIKADIWKPYD